MNGNSADWEESQLCALTMSLPLSMAEVQFRQCTGTYDLGRAW
jgi:hypothetical protein